MNIIPATAASFAFCIMLCAETAIAEVYKCDTNPVTYQDVPCDQPLPYNPPALTVAPGRDPVAQLRIMREIGAMGRKPQVASSGLSWGERQTIKNNKRALRSGSGGSDYRNFLKREASAIWGQQYVPDIPEREVVIDRSVIDRR